MFTLPNNPWLRTLIELTAFVTVAVALSMFMAYSPSLDDLIRGAIVGLILTCLSAASSRIAELQTAKRVRHQERKRATRVIEEITEREPDAPIRAVSEEIASKVQERK